MFPFKRLAYLIKHLASDIGIILALIHTVQVNVTKRDLCMLRFHTQDSDLYSDQAIL